MKFLLKKQHLTKLLFLFFAFLYYIFFANKILSLFDEGYFAHLAQRISIGEVPYKDFSLQYGPTYIYLLAGLYKIFGTSLIVGRYLNIIICVFIVGFVFAILNRIHIGNKKVWILSFLSLISFGYPLINITHLIWASVLSVTLSIYLAICILTSQERKIRLEVLLGISIAVSLSLKQNFGIFLIVAILPYLYFMTTYSLSEKIKSLLTISSVVVVLTFFWLYLFFFADNIQGLRDFYVFSKTFAQKMMFSYPPLSIALQPFGVFKLIPYYLPLILVPIIFVGLIKKTFNKSILLFSIISVGCFIVSVYPQSDLIHCYPFFGLVLVSILLLSYQSTWRLVAIPVVFLSIIIGFYLTFFTKAYRYESYYFEKSTTLPFERARGISLDVINAKTITEAGNYIQAHTTKDDYIFSYPHEPMFYFLLDRKNPSRDIVYFLRYWHFYDDEVIINEILSKKTKYIIASGNYVNDSKLSSFIQQQKIVYKTRGYTIFSIGY
ncbi:MAG: hypothetical protein HZC02_02225 [Candidatus Levybacteria bacterium]|nr:hypothetical protein [Candidatus Levybacteria bacterium]